MTSETIDRTPSVRSETVNGSDVEFNVCCHALYRRLRSQLEVTGSGRSVGITSCRSGAGSSTVAQGLAIAAAEEGESKVLLVKMSFRGTWADQGFDDNEDGGSSEIASLRDLLDRIVPSSVAETLWVLPLSAAYLRPRGASGRQAVQDAFRELAEEFSFVIVDLPPAEEVRERTPVDGIVLVIDAETTTRTLALASRDALSQSHLLGAVLNKQRCR